MRIDQSGETSVFFLGLGRPHGLAFDREGYLYVLVNQGILTCYHLTTGEVKYTERIPHQGSGFSGSPVAADGKLYLPSEDGDIFVVKAGAKFELLGKNPIGQLLMSTPALSGGLMFVRAEHDLFAIGR